mmetsp:Transcript_35224/g.83713  ORF Transcript_35224/g.83713 Transcript_35224/m.83713 type:complete len:395 (+) Transcript_35224:828-2012(+)
MEESGAKQGRSGRKVGSAASRFRLSSRTTSRSLRPRYHENGEISSSSSERSTKPPCCVPTGGRNVAISPRIASHLADSPNPRRGGSMRERCECVCWPAESMCTRRVRISSASTPPSLELAEAPALAGGKRSDTTMISRFSSSATNTAVCSSSAPLAASPPENAPFTQSDTPNRSCNVPTRLSAPTRHPPTCRATTSKWNMQSERLGPVYAYICPGIANPFRTHIPAWFWADTTRIRSGNSMRSTATASIPLLNPAALTTATPSSSTHGLRSASSVSTRVNSPPEARISSPSAAMRKRCSGQWNEMGRAAMGQSRRRCGPMAPRAPGFSLSMSMLSAGASVPGTLKQKASASISSRIHFQSDRVVRQRSNPAVVLANRPPAISSVRVPWLTRSSR